MRKVIPFVCLVLFFLPVSLLASSIPLAIAESSVTIVSPGYGMGSGTVIIAKDNSIWVLTAAHVVAGLKEESEVIDQKTGAKKTKVSFRDAKVVRHIVENGRTVGRLELDAEIIRYSPVENHDLALLKLRRGMFKTSAIFHLDKEIPEIGTDLYHCGSLLGEFGSNSLTAGIVSKHGRVLNNYTYDQVSCPSFPGSSGGGVFLKSNGKYIGMVTRGAGETFSLIVPVRRIQVWSKQVGIEFIVDPSIAIPSKEDLNKLPIEDNLKE